MKTNGLPKIVITSAFTVGVVLCILRLLQKMQHDQQVRNAQAAVNFTYYLVATGDGFSLIFDLPDGEAHYCVEITCFFCYCGAVFYYKQYEGWEVPVWIECPLCERRHIVVEAML